MAGHGGSARRSNRVAAGIVVATGALVLALNPAVLRAGEVNNPPGSSATSASPPAVTSSIPNPSRDESTFNLNETQDGAGPDTLPPVSYHDTPSLSMDGIPAGSLTDALTEGVNDYSPLGLALHSDQRRLASGETLSGLTIVSVKKGSAAERAGLHAFHNHVKKALEAASVAGGLFFWPALILTPIIEASHTGDHYDMIVGIDGYRVHDVLDFADGLRSVQPNQPIYLSVVHDGVRTQIQVKMPDTVTPQ